MSPLIELGVSWAARLVGALVLLAGVWLAARAAGRLTRSAADRGGLDGAVGTFAATAVRWSVRLLGVVLCLSLFGIETTSLAALLGGAGVAVGVALKGNLSNVASGLLLLGLRPFREGDWVEVDGRSGRVVRMNLMLTEIDTFDNARHWVPNSKWIEQGLLNHDHHPWRRADVDVGVAYDSDLDEVIAILERVARARTDPASDRPPLVRLQGFGASSIDLKVGVWCETPDLFQARHDLVLAIKGAFDAHEIEIPFPQRVLHLQRDQVEALAAK